LLGGYGAYFTTSQLFTTYATEDRHLSASSGGLLSALILLAGIPGSLLGGYWLIAARTSGCSWWDPTRRCRSPGPDSGGPDRSTLGLGIGIGFFLIFGFAAWLAVPARVCRIDHAYIGTATGLMLSLAAIGGFFTPIIFGHLVTHTSFTVGWVFLAVASFVFALLG